jgi:hypothetical protein
MFSLKSLMMIVVTMTVSSALVFANEPAHGEKKEEKAEGGHGEAAAPVEKPKGDTYAQVAAKVAAAEAKVKSGQDEIKHLIEEKAKTHDPAKIDEIVKQMVTTHKTLQQNVKDYDQQRALLKYRYPEKGMVGEREYERIEVKSLQDMENEMSVSSSVKRTLNKVRLQYDTPADKKARLEKEKSEGEHKEILNPTKAITDPVILKK